MRQGQNPRRNRGRPGKRPQQQQRPGKRSQDSSGPNVKVRGSAAQIYEKYQVLARDEQRDGNRVSAENLLQHAEHYYRVLTANGAGNRPDGPKPDRPDEYGASEPRAEQVNAQPKQPAVTPAEAVPSEPRPEPVEPAQSAPKDDQQPVAAKPRRLARRRKPSGVQTDGVQTDGEPKTGDPGESGDQAV